jgi:ABC-type Fe3+/spermidine/putrescine transport system ATPase subunit
MTLSIKQLNVSFDQHHLIRNLNLSLNTDEIVAILGPSGCGKTTLLRTIAGLKVQDSGRISLRNEPIQDMLCEQRGIGMLFQRPVLFPFKDVLGNILFAYQSKKYWNMDDVHEVMNEMGLLGKEQQSVETLSGGEAQRVVLARTLLTEPKLLLLDEPLSALDVDLRRKIAHEIRAVLKSRSIPAIHVTHDPAEAEIIGDRVIHWNELQPGGDDEE